MSDPGPHARFPWAPALLCAASISMAAWTWMRYSYAWDSRTLHTMDLGPEMAYDGCFPHDAYCVDRRAGSTFYGRAYVADDSEDAAPRYGLIVYTARSRWHPASVAGLVVAAFGTFVFALYLRRWLRERGDGAGAGNEEE